MNNQVLKFELSAKDVQIKKILNKEFLELDIYAISDVYPNKNNSSFTKESMELSKNTCYNKPILGYFDTLANDFDQHNGEDKYDKELDNGYWDTSSSNSEKPLGLIRESDTVEIVEVDGINWLKISCAIWTTYSYKQVKKLLKSPTKKVSVEILVKRSHFDEDGIQVIDEFILTGITILGDRVSEGIPGAHLNILDLMGQQDFSNQVKCLAFAYNKKFGDDINAEAVKIESDVKSDDKLEESNIKLENKDDKDTADELYNKKTLEVSNMTYSEKLGFLNGKLREVIGEDQWMYICDYTDDYIICATDEGYYKIPYSVEENEDTLTVEFDMEAKVEQVPSFKDMPKEFVQIEDEQKNIDEVYAMYQDASEKLNESEEKFATLEGEYNNYKEEMDSKVYSVVIEEVEYNVSDLADKYAEVMGELDNTKVSLEEVSNQFAELKEKCEKEAQEKLCGDGIAMVDEEDELDDDDKEEIKEKCRQNAYSSIEEVETDIAKAVYQYKKNNRQKTFKSNVIENVKIDDSNVSIFDRI